MDRTYNKISLEYFERFKQHYHVYKISKSAVSEELHYHDYYQISYVSRGEIIHRQERDSVRLVRGDAFIIPPGFVHSVNFVGANAEIFSLSLAPEMFHSGLTSSTAYRFLTSLSLAAPEEERLGIRLRVKLDENQRASAEALFDCLIRESDEPWSQSLSAATHIIVAIILLMAQAYHARQYDVPETRYHHEYMEACVKYIDQNFIYPIRMDDLLRRFGISRSSFTSLFPRYTGVTMKAYINKKRIEHSLGLARVKTLPFSEVAAMVGYKDFSTFYRNFVKYVGLPPMQYRQRSCQEEDAEPAETAGVSESDR